MLELTISIEIRAQQNSEDLYLRKLLKESGHSALYAKVRPEPPDSLMQVTLLLQSTLYNS